MPVKNIHIHISVVKGKPIVQYFLLGTDEYYGWAKRETQKILEAMRK
jgi:hypothetical protein